MSTCVGGDARLRQQHMRRQTHGSGTGSSAAGRRRRCAKHADVSGRGRQAAPTDRLATATQHSHVLGVQEYRLACMHMRTYRTGGPGRAQQPGARGAGPRNRHHSVRHTGKTVTDIVFPMFKKLSHGQRHCSSGVTDCKPHISFAMYSHALRSPGHSPTGS
jgi:hypothetical protein